MKSVSKPLPKARPKPKIKLRQSLFWDVDPKTIDLKKNARYVIERVMDFGRDDEVRWLIRYYPKKSIEEALTKSRQLQPRTRALWTLICKQLSS